MRDPPFRNRDTRATLAYHEATKHSERSAREPPRSRLSTTSRCPSRSTAISNRSRSRRIFPRGDVPALQRDRGARAAAPQRATRERIPDLPTLARVLCICRRGSPSASAIPAERSCSAPTRTPARSITSICTRRGRAAGPRGGRLSLRPARLRAAAAASGRPPRARCSRRREGSREIARAPLVIASASTYWRNAWKYQARAYRHCFWDGGTLHANLLAAAASEALEPQIVLGFADGPVERLLGLDPRARARSRWCRSGARAAGARRAARSERAEHRDGAALALRGRLPGDSRAHAASSLARRRRGGGVARRHSRAPSRPRRRGSLHPLCAASRLARPGRIARPRDPQARLDARLRREPLDLLRGALAGARRRHARRTRGLPRPSGARRCSISI